jgi:hypothetical protein
MAVPALRSLSLRFTRAALILAGAAAALGATACAAPSKAQRVQEAAYELNMGLRFGYNTQALNKVAIDHRREFLRQHRDWASRLRIVDLDLAGLDLREDAADVFVQVLWQPVDSTIVRTTVIHQTWKDKLGSWMLVSEERAQGDQGLIDEVDKKKPSGGDGDKKPADAEKKSSADDAKKPAVDDKKALGSDAGKP